MAEELYQRIERKALNYMRSLLQLMLDWRAKEVEMLTRLAKRVAKRLYDELRNYELVPVHFWKPRLIVKRVDEELGIHEFRPYLFVPRYPVPQGEDYNLFYDTLDVYNYTVEQREYVMDDTVVWREAVMKPLASTGRKVVIPKVPYFDAKGYDKFVILENVRREVSALDSVMFEVEATGLQPEEGCECREAGTTTYCACRPVTPSYGFIDVEELYIPLWNYGRIDVHLPMVGGAPVLYFHGVTFTNYIAMTYNILDSAGELAAQVIVEGWYGHLTKFTRFAENAWNTQDLYVYMPAYVLLIAMRSKYDIRYLEAFIGGSRYQATFKDTDSEGWYITAMVFLKPFAAPQTPWVKARIKKV